MQATATGNVEFLRQWIGRRETATDWIAPFPARAMAATLDSLSAPDEGDELPLLWHWLYFLHVAPRAGIGPDGHPKRGGFMPPVPLPRRMFGAARFEFHAPLRVGDNAERRSEIRDVVQKTGRSGTMVFVTVRHEIHANGTLAIVDEQDIVYREPPAPGSASINVARDTPPPAESRQPWRTDEVLLFRYAALTFNAHRIHYDRPYATGEEGYPGLVVQGPLVATLLAGRARELAGRRLARFQFRAIKPLFDHQTFDVCARAHPGGGIDLWTEDETRAITMQASATFHD